MCGKAKQQALSNWKHVWTLSYNVFTSAKERKDRKHGKAGLVGIVHLLGAAGANSELTLASGVSGVVVKRGLKWACLGPLGTRWYPWPPRAALPLHSLYAARKPSRDFSLFKSSLENFSPYPCFLHSVGYLLGTFSEKTKNYSFSIGELNIDKDSEKRSVLIAQLLQWRPEVHMSLT